MINTKTSNIDVCFLVLARPADMLSRLAQQVLPAGAEVCFSACVYDAVASLLGLGPHMPVVLITRPAMLAKPHLPTILRQFPNLRTVGWLSPGESPDPYITEHVGQAMVTVSTPEELANVIAALARSLSAAPTPVNAPAGGHERQTALEPAHYRLSDEELEALLGAGQ